jgi:hypothetical protein
MSAMMNGTAIAALIVTGKVPKPDLAVIADTGREKSATWDYLERYIVPALQSVGVVQLNASPECVEAQAPATAELGKGLLEN